jgi:16S rRNA (guanine527-N7)-methyltransferase
MFHVKHSSLSPEDFCQQIGISQAQLDRFSIYAELLERWQKRINLVGPSTLPDLWRRHFLDSAQLLPLIPPGTNSIADIGSGAGFPGLVLALLGAPDVHLIESDQRKMAFLREAARATETAVTLHPARAESLDLKVDLVTARAFTSLDGLLDHAEKLLRPGGKGLFLKGRNLDHELTEAAKNWNMEVERIPSSTDPDAFIVKVGAIHRGRSDPRPRP